MTIVENPDAVVGGVDTHADVHVAAVVNRLGGVLGVESFSTTSHGYRLNRGDNRRHQLGRFNASRASQSRNPLTSIRASFPCG
jgi:hypothetical protein